MSRARNMGLKRDKVVLPNSQNTNYSMLVNTFSRVRAIINKYKETGITENKHISGRPRILTCREQQRVINLIQKQPSESAHSLLSDMLQDRTRWLVQKPFEMC